MKLIRLIAALGLAASLSACMSVETATRNAPMETQPMAGASVGIQAVQVVDYKITVSHDLHVSEANLIYPIGDIVWRGDAPGDRYAQIGAIFDEAMQMAKPNVNGALPVIAEIELVRFHALTERARYTVGGVHNIRFMLTLRDPVSGAVIHGLREIQTDLKTYGGSTAIEADRRGLTQKVRITRHLANVLATELMQPGMVQGGMTQYVAGLESGPLKL